MFVEQLSGANPEQVSNIEAQRISGKRAAKKRPTSKQAKSKSASTSKRIDDALAALENLRAK